MTATVDPNDFIISRKRKKYRFAIFRNNPLCFELDEWKKKAVDVVELGAGTALFAVELASRYPDKKFVAVDVKADRLQKGACEADERKLKNISFVRARADQLDQVTTKNSIELLWVTFPDPFPRERSENRRLTHPKFLQLYAGLIRPNGSFLLKHDNRIFFDWSLEQLLHEGWKIIEKTTDLHNSSLPDDYKIKTTYEMRWMSEGLFINFVSARPSVENN